MLTDDLQGPGFRRQGERMDSAQRLVHQFYETFDLGAPPRPTLDDFPAELRIRLIEEELAEFREAVAQGDLVEVVDALCDLLYVTYGAGVALGVDLEPFFVEVHRSNMAKRGGAQRTDGKQLKPADWQPPRIAELLEDLYPAGKGARASRTERDPKVGR